MEAGDRFPVTESEVVAEICRVSGELAESLSAVLADLGLDRATSGELGRALGVSRILAHRLLTSIGKKDPLATAHAIPGPDPLQRVLKSARSKGSNAELVARADRAVGEFSELVQSVGGDRAGLDAIIASSLPEARTKIEAAAKQSVYRGMRQLAGVAADITLQTSIIRPSDTDPDRHDWATVHGLFGVRRLRPGANLKLGVKSGADLEGARHRTLTGEPVDDLRGLLLPEFASGPPAKVSLEQVDTRMVYQLDWGDEVGSGTERDVIIGELYRAAMRRARPADDPRPMAGIISGVEVPTRVGIYDVILHRDVFPDWIPQVRILETGERGSADPNDATRDVDVLNVLERVDELGWRTDRFRTEEIPRYVDLLRHTCDALKWDPEEFRGYRTRIDYPIWNSQVQFSFEVPIG